MVLSLCEGAQIMSRHAHAQAYSPLAYDDPVRREAYEHAMRILNNRPGVSDAMTTDQREFIRNFDAPEVLGNKARLPLAGR
jgi:hypothetical protein